MFSNFLIGLREGLEASLVVGILVAYLVKTDRRDRLPAVWAGVVIAIVGTIGFVGVLELTSNSLDDEAAEAFAGVMSLLTVGFLTWMIFWMRRTSHLIKHDLHEKMHKALGSGGFALTLLAIVAVGREGIETGMFLWTNEQAAGSASHPAIGGVLGLLVSAFLGWMLYRRAVRFNLSTFFKITGALLIVVAAGVLVYGIHEFQELGWLPGEDALALDISSWWNVDAWYGSLAKGLIGFTPKLSVLQVLAWFAYVVPVMTLFFRSSPEVSASSPTAEPAADAVVTAG